MNPERLLEHFDRISEAETAKLRNKTEGHSGGGSVEMSRELILYADLLGETTACIRQALIKTTAHAGILPQAVAKLESAIIGQRPVAIFALDATIQMLHTINNNTRQASQRCSNWRVTHFQGGR